MGRCEDRRNDQGRDGREKTSPDPMLAAMYADPPKTFDEYHVVYDIVDDLGGSISAEHGIGILKKKQLHKRADKTKINVMKSLKTVLDPDGILNPRVFF